VLRRLLERTGLLLSLKKVYYAAEARLNRQRARALFAHVCGPGDLVFDVGANLGQKTGIFEGLGARVIAIEPERSCAEYIRRRFRASQRVVVVNAAVSDAPGRLELHVSPQTPEISTLDPAWLSSGPDRDKVGAVEMQVVEVVTLAQLVERFGTPDYVKIDVEGFETRVLRGLTTPAACASFEFHDEHEEELRERCAILSQLGDYVFNYTIANSYTLALPSWTSADALAADIRARRRAIGKPVWGDIFASTTGMKTAASPQG
jgi:FkbM family methyltransferase